MRRTSIFPAVFLVVVICLVAVGFYRGWFVVSSDQDASTDKVHVKLTIDPDQIKTDTKHAAEEAQDEASKVSKKVHQEAKSLTNKTNSAVH